MSFFNKKTTLITGATGLIGSHLVQTLMLMNEAHVIALGRNEQKLRSTFAEYLENPRFSYIVHDVSQPFDLKGRMVDVIFHAASPMSEKTIINTPVDVICPNLLGTINCLELLRNQKNASEKNGRIVLFSSVTVYGNLSNKDITVSERDTLIAPPLDSERAPYSEAKRMTEVIARAYAKQYNLDVVIARLSTIYGAAVSQPETAFFSFLDKVVANEDIVIRNSGIARRDNLYIDDAVSGLLLVCEKGETGQAYNISSNGELENFKAIDEIAEIMVEVGRAEYGCSTEVIYRSDKNKTRSSGKILNNAKLKSLGWEVTVNHTDGIRKILEYRLNTEKEKTVKDGRKPI